MTIVPSTERERYRFRCLEYSIRKRIERIVSAGGQAHIIWDIDSVLVSSRSDDVFTLLGFDVKRYFEYEERLIAEPLENGPWMGFASQVGGHGRHVSQDIVTARSSFLALRVTLLLLNQRLPMRWQLFVGHQSKKESYRIILESFKKKPDFHVFMIDDAVKHVRSFTEVANELDMTDRCHGVCSPQLRDHDHAEIEREIKMVLGDPNEAERPEVPRWEFITTQSVQQPRRRVVTVVPRPHDFLRETFVTARSNVWQQSLVEQHRTALEDQASGLWPGKKCTDEELYQLYQITMDIIVP